MLTVATVKSAILSLRNTPKLAWESVGRLVFKAFGPDNKLDVVSDFGY